MTNNIYEKVKANRFKKKHYSKETVNKITQSNLIQLIIWIDESKLIYKHGLFRVAANEKYVIYENYIYNHYKGDLFPPIYALTEIFDFTFPQAVYLLNYFYYKVSKSEVEDYIKTKYKPTHSIMLVDGDTDLNYILQEDGFISGKAHYCYTRAIAYLSDTRKIDKDIILNFIKQGFIKMDALDNLCFITYKEPIAKDVVIAITRKGTTSKEFKNNLIKEHYTGFFYSKKELLELKDFDTVYVFESCVDLLSFLTLIKNKKIILPDNENSCFISLNGVGNRKYLQKVLNQFPTIEKIAFCLDNDSKGISGMECIKKEYVLNEIGCYPNIETAYLYDFIDLRFILKDISGKYGYCKDWNDVLKINFDVQYKINDI